MRRALLAVVVALAGRAWAASEQPPGPPEPRFILYLDAALLAEPNVGAGGSGGGIEISVDGGTEAGLRGGGGVAIGGEVRLSRWLAVDAGVSWYRPSLEVARTVPAPDQPADDRSASVDLRLVEVGLVIAPPKLRIPAARLAFGILAVRSDVSGVPESLGLAIDGSDTGIGIDARGEIFFSKDRHWGMGMALAFMDVGPGFTDLETGAADTLQVSGMTLRLGLRGTW